ncbi:hypothetical protein D3C80_2161490 [compost metagenome]
MFTVETCLPSFRFSLKASMSARVWGVISKSPSSPLMVLIDAIRLYLVEPSHWSLALP